MAWEYKPVPGLWPLLFFSSLCIQPLLCLSETLKRRTREIARRGRHLFAALQKDSAKELSREDTEAQRGVEQLILALHRECELLRATLDEHSWEFGCRQEDHCRIVAEIERLRQNVDVLKERLAADEGDRRTAVQTLTEQQRTKQVEREKEHISFLQPGCHEEARRCELELLVRFNLEYEQGERDLISGVDEVRQKEQPEAQRVEEEWRGELEGDSRLALLSRAPVTGDLEQEKCARLAAERKAALEELHRWREWADEQSLRELMTETAWLEELKLVRDDMNQQMEEAHHEVVRENRELRQRLLDIEGEPDGLARMHAQMLELEQRLAVQTEQLEAETMRSEVLSKAQHELPALRCSLEAAQMALAEANHCAAEELRALESRLSRAEARAVVAEDELAEARASLDDPKQRLEEECHTKLAAEGNKYTEAAEHEFSSLQQAQQELCLALTQTRQLQEREEVYHLEMQRMSEQSAELAGHSNHKQKIRHLLTVNAENQALRAELRKARQQLAQLEDDVCGEAVVVVTPRRQRGPSTPGQAGPGATPPRRGNNSSSMRSKHAGEEVALHQVQEQAVQTPRASCMPKILKMAKVKDQGKAHTPDLKDRSPAPEPEFELSPRCFTTAG